MTTTAGKTIEQAVDYQTEATVLGGAEETLRLEQVSEFVATAVAGAGLENQRVCLVVPDGTRTCPLPLLLQAMRDGLASASEVTVVIALGTHQGMSDEHLARHLGYNLGELEETYPEWHVLNHEFWLPETFTTVGTISADRIAELTGGLLTDTAVDVRINRHVAEADVVIVVGPVFPHEVVGFSGGNKYFFPRGVRTGTDQLVALGRRLDHQCRNDRHARDHPGPGVDRRSSEHDSDEALGIEPCGGLRHQHLARSGVWYARGVMGSVRRHLVADPCHLS